MKRDKKNRSGITLIALVVTIVILLILAGITLNAILGNNGLIERLNAAKFKQIMKGYQENTNLFVAAQQTQDIIERKITNINAGVHADDANTEIEKIIPKIEKKYKEKVAVEKNEFCYVPLDKKDNQIQKEVKWCFEVNIKVKGYSSYEDFLEGIAEVEVSNGEYTEVNGVYCCSPDLTGFNYNQTYYVTWDENGKELIGDKISKEVPNDWYDYGQKKWANVVTISGDKMAYFVWIPRYVYMIDQEAKTNQSVKVKFVDKWNNYKDGKTGEVGNYPDIEIKTDSNGIQNNFCLPEAFKWDGQDIAGYWVSKYEVTIANIECQFKTFNTKIVAEKIGNSGINNIASYDVYLDGKLVENITEFPYEFSDLQSNTEYRIKIVAKDSIGNIIGILPDETIKTLKADTKTMIKPDLTGFNKETTYYVTYQEDGTEDSSIPISQGEPDNWYDYDSKKWANIVTKSGDKMAYFVWIPRYEYKLKPVLQETEIRFIGKEQKDATNGYLLPEAFKWDGQDIAGYWVSKYEVSL